jgi:hypothetical protein
MPHPTTVMRLLSRLDGDAFDTAVTTCLQAQGHRRQNGEGGLRAVAVDGKQLRGSRTVDGKAVWLLAAMDHSGTVIAQRQIDAKSNTFHSPRDQVINPDRPTTRNGPKAVVGGWFPRPAEYCWSRRSTRTPRPSSRRRSGPRCRTPLRRIVRASREVGIGRALPRATDDVQVSHPNPSSSPPLVPSARRCPVSPGSDAP